MTAPRRIRLSRAKGWRKPEGAMVVARPGDFGNPFTIASARDTGIVGSDARLRQLCVDAFRSWLAGSSSYWQGAESDRRRARLLERLPELRGQDLACWCSLDGPCHADVLLELANA